MNQTRRLGKECFPDKDWKRSEKYIEKLSSGEKILFLGHFSGMKSLGAALVIILGTVLINRHFLGNTFVMTACNIGAMLAAFESSKSVSAAQNAVAVITDHRIIGVMETKTFDLKYQDIRSIGTSNHIFLDTGIPATSIHLKYMTNAGEFYRILQKHYRQAQ